MQALWSYGGKILKWYDWFIAILSICTVGLILGNLLAPPKNISDIVVVQPEDFERTDYLIDTPNISNFTMQDITNIFSDLFDNAKTIDAKFYYDADRELKINVSVVRFDGTTWEGHLDISATFN